MKSFYADVTVIEKRRIRVDFDAKKKPSKEEMLRMLNDLEYNDITDEESIEYISVEAIDVGKLEDE